MERQVLCLGSRVTLNPESICISVGVATPALWGFCFCFFFFIQNLVVFPLTVISQPRKPVGSDRRKEKNRSVLYLGDLPRID